jgi:adenylyl-sulfate kinase
MNKNSPVIWLTGMSGSGKSTLANKLKKNIESKGYTISIIDGDSVRDADNKKLGFGLDDVRTNNMHIASLCNKYRSEFDLVVAPVISPYNKVREEVRNFIEPNFHLVYLQTDIDSLKNRDPKGLYASADRGDIIDLIGYSEVNPYDEPDNSELVISTANNISLEDSFATLLNYVKQYL